MEHRTNIFEGAAIHDDDHDLARVVPLPVRHGASPDPAPHPVYSLDGLLALALAVRGLEVTG